MHFLSAMIEQVAQSSAEPIATVVAHYVLAAVGTGLGWSIHRAAGRLREMEHTRAKANICFDDLKERKPEVIRVYEAIMRRNGS